MEQTRNRWANPFQSRSSATEKPSDHEHQAIAASDSVPLQSLIWPELGMSTEQDLYVKLNTEVGLSLPEHTLRFAPGGFADFGTAMNLFNIGKWHKYCGIEDLSLELDGDGTFEVIVFHAYPDHSWTRLINTVVTLKDGVPQHFALEDEKLFKNRGVLMVHLKALSSGVLRDMRWHTEQAPRRTPKLMLSITTFRREKAVQETVKRFEDFVATSALRDHLHLTVVDNGQSADIAASEHVTPIGNENLGGSGGFARGLIAAKDRGASHCLFMDDDAAIHMPALERTWVFLAHAIDERTAVCGSLVNAQHRWRMWESGACFDRHCHPQFIGLDLRDTGAVLHMEFASTADKPSNYYGGWWYFAFPVAEADHMPFPFFVRGDDISFSLMNDFLITPLPGVVCFQDEDFSSKESPQTLYLDLRSHLAHHLVAPQVSIGRRGVVKVASWFFARSFVNCHYETLSALNLSLRDALTGPEFFSDNADMSKRRAEIKDLITLEKWQPLEGEPPKERRRFNPERASHRMLMKATLNGHLLPFFSHYGNHINLPADLRGATWPVWGASQITYISTDGKQSYTVKHDKKRAWKEAHRYGLALWELWRDYDGITSTWRDGYTKLAKGSFWSERLKLRKP